MTHMPSRADFPVALKSWPVHPSHRALWDLLDAAHDRQVLEIRLESFVQDILKRFPVTGVCIYVPDVHGEPIHVTAGDLSPDFTGQAFDTFRRMSTPEAPSKIQAFVLSSPVRDALNTCAGYGVFMPIVNVPEPGFLLLVLDDIGVLSEKAVDMFIWYAHILAHVFADVQVLQDLRTLLEASRDLVESQDLGTVLHRLLTHAMSITATEAASILLQDSRTGKLVFKAATGPHPERLQEITVPLNSIAGRALREQRPIVIKDVSQSPEHFRLVDQTTGFCTKSLIAMPLRWREGCIGVLEVLNKRGGVFNEHDLKMLEALAGQAAAIIVQAHLNEERKRALQELRELDRRKTQFMHLASHELRTPLTVIRGYAEMAEEILSQTEVPDAATWESIKMLIGEIHNGAKRMSAVVDEITRAAGRVPHPLLQAMTPVDLRDILTSVMKELWSWAESKQLRVQVDMPSHPVIVLGDKARLQDALLHVVGNAVKFTPPQGQVDVVMWTEEGRVLLSVSDTGPGIPPEEHTRIFEPFYQVEDPLTRQHPGMGLGLTIAKDVVEQHAGYISVDSAPGRGSTFTIVLPLEPTDPPSS